MRNLSSRRDDLRVALNVQTYAVRRTRRQVERVKVNDRRSEKFHPPRAPVADNFRERARKIPDRESLFTNGPQGE